MLISPGLEGSLDAVFCCLAEHSQSFGAQAGSTPAIHGQGKSRLASGRQLTFLESIAEVSLIVAQKV